MISNLIIQTVQMRLKSVSNIAKITKSMKMIASTKMNKAQRAMETARVYGESANGELILLLSINYNYSIPNPPTNNI